MKLLSVIPSYYKNSFFFSNNHMPDKQLLHLALDLFEANQEKVIIKTDDEGNKDIKEPFNFDGFKVVFVEKETNQEFEMLVSYKGGRVFVSGRILDKEKYFYNWNNYFTQAKAFQKLCNSRLEAYQEAREFELQEAF